MSKLAKLIIASLTLILSIPISFAFIDNNSGDKYYIAISHLEKEGFLKGYEDGTFKSQNDLSRAEALKMVMSLRERQLEVPTENPYEDVEAEAWHAPYIHQAKLDGIIADKAFFYPEKPISLNEFLLILLESQYPDLNFPTLSYEQNFLKSDIPADNWAAPYFQFALSKEILNIYDSNTVNPAQTMTRGYASELIYRLLQSEENGSRFGKATFYGKAVQGNGTASGERFDYNLHTAAHKTLPFGTKVEVTNLANGKTVVVKINDRGPHGPGRVLDLSSSAFSQIASLGAGIINVQYKIAQP